MTSPLKMDPEVKELLTQLEHVRTARTFKRWKSSFLNKWEEFLEEENIHAADGAYKEFAVQMGQFVKLINTVNEFVDKGELAIDKTVVKARNSLNEMSKFLTIVINAQDSLIPQTNALEKQRGYNKFHMGAVLIRDNFGEYGRLVTCREILQHMRTVSLEQVADKQILEEMDNFSAKLQKFCDVMADLGLFGMCRSGAAVLCARRQLPGPISNASYFLLLHGI
jgi:acetolactate synthase small subunit